MRRRLTHNVTSSTDTRKRLRQNLTPAEALLWTNLKNSQLAGKKFRRQHSIGPFIVDFYCPECRVAVELDGDGHMTEAGAESDEKRTEFLKRFNMTVIRFENREVFHDLEGVLETIRRSLGTTPSCAVKVASRHFLDGAATPPNLGGELHHETYCLFAPSYLPSCYILPCFSDSK
jgi:very-short-patch-repair endonuclease